MLMLATLIFQSKEILIELKQLSKNPIILNLNGNSYMNLDLLSSF